MSSPVPNAAGEQPGPLAGVRVIEFSHMVMGPSAGMVLADLGADVIKIEPAPAGDNTRRLTGLAIGFFPAFNRNKRSVCVNMKRPEGMALVRKLAADSDVLIENFRPGAMEKLGLGPDRLGGAQPAPRLLLLQGFPARPLRGPRGARRGGADDGRPRLHDRSTWQADARRLLGERHHGRAVRGHRHHGRAARARPDGVGGLVQSGLFETNMVLMAQHMARAGIDGREPQPFGDPDMPKPWPLYDIFDSADEGQQVFVGVVTDTQWRGFCEAFGLQDLLADPELGSMRQLAAARPRLKPRVAEVFRKLPKAELMARCEALGLPFAPINRPGDLFSDPHLLASGGLLPVDLSGAENAPGGAPARGDGGLPGLPLVLPSGRPGLRRQPPRAGEHGVEVARRIGFSEEEIAKLVADGTLSTPERAAAGKMPPTPEREAAAAAAA